MRVVADSGPLIAFVDRSERAHRVARRLVHEIGPDLLVPDGVVAEVDIVLRRRIGATAGGAFLKDVGAGMLRRVPLDSYLFERAVQYDERYAALDLGIVDALVMALAEAERATILTFDFQDFRAARPLRGGWWRLLVDEAGLRRLLR